MPLLDLPLEQLREYSPEVREPDDFDEFWSTTIAEARTFSAPVDARRVEAGMSLVDTFDVTFPGFDGEAIKGWLNVPAGPLRGAIIEYNGYGGGRGLPHERLRWAAAGFAHFFMDNRGQGSSWGSGGETPDRGVVSASVPGVMTRGVLDRDTYYFRRLYTDAVRAVDAVRSLDIVDPSLVALVGSSQGGGLAIAVSALVGDVVASMPSVPFLSHFERSVSMAMSDPYSEIVRYLSVHRGQEERVFETLSYFDAVNFARRATVPALFASALMDPVCLPSTVFAAANAWQGPMTMEVYPYNEHEGGGEHHWVTQERWIRTYLPEVDQR
ncbi:cephalosporin-C deacetylase [Microbacteriaceae bacterium SG_E_30_P1]|uniref:Cephalosporin-C deacetylase n=1 Tax=Antiquaquibacter oligotrophicus TaxID=2880260 RepID=A0ABT6KNT5_9MICO|nr:acetylxylan esterase [Antiquaquibacter oligotrophicus]MDH6181665.1 cephalosporin-C deacetylase [Antiquaquibacter oligotrophicus]UDF12651.1 acetylxylan esterase [Antiquaquibacter oligotrophicus]